MTDPLDPPPAAREAATPRPGRRVLLSSLRVLVAVALVVTAAAGGYAAYTHHAEKVAEQAHRRTEIREARDAVTALAAGHTVYAPAEWGARQYPSAGGTRIVSWGRYRGVHVAL